MEQRTNFKLAQGAFEFKLMQVIDGEHKDFITATFVACKSTAARLELTVSYLKRLRVL